MADLPGGASSIAAFRLRVLIPLALVLPICVDVSRAQPAPGSSSPTIVRAPAPAQPPAPPVVAPTRAPVAAAASPLQTTEDWWRSPPVIVTSLISGVFGLGGTALALVFGFRGTKATINQKTNEAELVSIGLKLSTFYGPYLQRSGENKLLAEELHARQPEGFRTLLSLLRPGWLDTISPLDRTLVKEIVRNGSDLRDMIRDKSGMVDEDVRAYLARAGTHFTMLALASEGALEDDRVRFERYVYPRDLDAVLRKDMERLQARAELLRREPGKVHAPLAPLVIPACLSLEPWPEPMVEA